MDYIIRKIGTLKYSRLKSMSILRKEINSYGYMFNMKDIKELFDLVCNNKLNKSFDLKYKICFDMIFDGNEYIKINDEPIEKNFPDNWIMPIG